MYQTDGIEAKVRVVGEERPTARRVRRVPRPSCWSRPRVGQPAAGVETSERRTSRRCGRAARALRRAGGRQDGGPGPVARDGAGAGGARAAEAAVGRSRARRSAAGTGGVGRGRAGPSGPDRPGARRPGIRKISVSTSRRPVSDAWTLAKVSVSTGVQGCGAEAARKGAAERGAGDVEREAQRVRVAVEIGVDVRPRRDSEVGPLRLRPTWWRGRAPQRPRRQSRVRIGNGVRGDLALAEDLGEGGRSPMRRQTSICHMRSWRRGASLARRTGRARCRRLDVGDARGVAALPGTSPARPAGLERRRLACGLGPPAHPGRARPPTATVRRGRRR